MPELDYISRSSFDPEVLTVDSLVFSPDSTSAQLCVTGRSAGQARVAVSAWDTTTFKYLGEYARYHVLQPPLTVSLETTEWELGVGQSHPVSLILTDDHGTAVAIQPEWADSWDVSDASMLAIDNGVLTARTSGSSAFRVTCCWKNGSVRCWGYNGGILGYPFAQNIGDDEHPATAGDSKLFPGPVTRDSQGALVAAYPDLADPLAGSVVVVPESSAGGDRPWRGPLAGPDGVILPDSVGRAANPG